MAPCQERGTGWCTHWADVVLRQLNALMGELVDHWCSNWGAVEAQVTPTKIISQDKEDVGLIQFSNCLLTLGLHEMLDFTICSALVSG